MKYKLIHAEFFPETGESEVAIENKNGIFIGLAQCHPEEQHPSKFAGCRIAEVRAHIQAAQYEKKILNYQIKELQNFEKILKGLKNYNPNSLEARRLRRRIHELKEEKNKKNNLILSMKRSLKKSMDERDELIKKHFTLKDVMKDQYHKDKSE